MEYLTDEAIIFTDAANYTAKKVREIIKKFRAENPNNKELARRSDISYLNEWAVHALSYRLGILKERARDAFLQFYMEPEVRFMYNVLGFFARPILKIFPKKVN